MICPTCKKEVSIIKKETDEYGKVINYFSCGHKLFELTVTDSVQAYDLLSIKKKGPKNFSKDHKFEYETIIGERMGEDGKPAFVHQIVDRIKNYYKKFVKQGDKVIKDIEDKLTNHK